MVNKEWILPGQPVEVELWGKTLLLKPMTHADRLGLVKQLQSVEEGVDGVGHIIEILASAIVSIKGHPGDPIDLIKYQKPDFIPDLVQVVLEANSLTETEAKNSNSSLDTQPETDSTTAPTPAPTASNEGQ